MQTTLDGLGGQWTKFTEALVESEGMLKKHKEKFKTSLLGQAEEFKKQVSYLLLDDWLLSNLLLDDWLLSYALLAGWLLSCLLLDGLVAY